MGIGAMWRGWEAQAWMGGICRNWRPAQPGVAGKQGWGVVGGALGFFQRAYICQGIFRSPRKCWREESGSPNQYRHQGHLRSSCMEKNSSGKMFAFFGLRNSRPFDFYPCDIPHPHPYAERLGFRLHGLLMVHRHCA